MAGPRKGVVGHFMEVRMPVARGKLLTHQGQPAAGRQIHFENRVSGDVFLTKARGDGSFSLALAPGAYDLRDEDGPIIVRYIDVRDQDINLGTVSEPRAPCAAARERKNRSRSDSKPRFGNVKRRPRKPGRRARRQNGWQNNRLRQALCPR